MPHTENGTQEEGSIDSLKYLNIKTNRAAKYRIKSPHMCYAIKYYSIIINGSLVCKIVIYRCNGTHFNYSHYVLYKDLWSNNN